MKKMPRNTANEGSERSLQWELQNTTQRNQRWHKQIEKHSMLMGRKNQYLENDCAAQSNLQIQYYFYQATNVIFHIIFFKKNYTEIHMKPKRNPNCQSNPKQ